MKAKLRRLHSPDAADLQSWLPPDAEFGILIQALIGPAGKSGEESFDFVLCTPNWFSRKSLSSDAIASGYHMLFVEQYDYGALIRYVEDAVHRAEADSWPELAKSLSWLGAWEFDSYRS